MIFKDIYLEGHDISSEPSDRKPAAVDLQQAFVVYIIQ